MSAFDLIIRGGTVVTASDRSRCDVGIRDGKVVALADRLTNAERIIDATGKLVLPGGIDAHCHLDQPRAQGLASGGAVMADDFESGWSVQSTGMSSTLAPSHSARTATWVAKNQSSVKSNRSISAW